MYEINLTKPIFDRTNSYFYIYDFINIIIFWGIFYQEIQKQGHYFNIISKYIDIIEIYTLKLTQFYQKNINYIKNYFQFKDSIRHLSILNLKLQILLFTIFFKKEPQSIADLSTSI